MNIDWDKLDFGYRDTKCHIRFAWRDGAWTAGELCDEPYMQLHVAATALHYGQAAFEGLKAFACQDGRVRVFRAADNWQRMADTARRIRMPMVERDIFMDAIQQVVAANIDYVPPYGSDGALYIRPLLIGSGPRIGVTPADEYIFLILVVPVGDYYKGGLTPVSAVVMDDYDRAAPQGVGNVKVAGNYAAGMEPDKLAKDQGFPINLFLDAREHKYVDEFGTSNFIGITQDGTYVTPDSHSILPSITNKVLQTLAQEAGMQVERRPVPWTEVGKLAEVAACGTAVVITPVNRIVRGDEVLEVGPREGCGPTLLKLYRQVRAIQQGEFEDKWGWMTEIQA